MDVLTSETCWALNKASDIKLVSLYSTIKMMHGPINTSLNICLVLTTTKCTVLGGILQRACLASGLCLLVLWQCNVILVLLLTELSAGKKGKSENLLPEFSECFYMHSLSISEPCVQGGTFYYTHTHTHTHMWEFDVIFVDSSPKFGLVLTLGFIFVREFISVGNRSYWTDGLVRQCTGQAVWTWEEPRTQICNEMSLEAVT